MILLIKLLQIKIIIIIIIIIIHYYYYYYYYYYCRHKERTILLLVADMPCQYYSSAFMPYNFVCLFFSWFHRTAGGIQIQGEEEISVELIEERERAIRQLEVSAVFLLQY